MFEAVATAAARHPRERTSPVSTIDSAPRQPSVSVGPAPGIDPRVRADRARIPLKTPAGIFGKLITWYSKRAYGEVLEPGLALSNNRRVLVADLILELQVGKLKALDPTLTMLAVMATSVQIECSWCLDFGYYQAHHQGVDPAKMTAVPRWREADVYSPTERRVLEYAEAMTATPPTVSDVLAAELRSDLGDAAFVELTFMVSMENLRSRTNAALGLASQGFAESCRVPKSP